MKNILHGGFSHVWQYIGTYIFMKMIIYYEHNRPKVHRKYLEKIWMNETNDPLDYLIVINKADRCKPVQSFSKLFK